MNAVGINGVGGGRAIKRIVLFIHFDDMRLQRAVAKQQFMKRNQCPSPRRTGFSDFTRNFSDHIPGVVAQSTCTRHIAPRIRLDAPADVSAKLRKTRKGARPQFIRRRRADSNG
jgi:hypothetical protein